MTWSTNHRTGRTTRMLAEAKRLNDAGHAVYVLGTDAAHSTLLMTQYQERYGQDGVKFEPMLSLRYKINTSTGALTGAHPNCIVLADHHAVEQWFPWVVRMAKAEFKGGEE